MGLRRAAVVASAALLMSLVSTARVAAGSVVLTSTACAAVSGIARAGAIAAMSGSARTGTGTGAYARVTGIGTLRSRIALVRRIVLTRD
jgi:hypothetical protein